MGKHTPAQLLVTKSVTISEDHGRADRQGNGVQIIAQTGDSLRRKKRARPSPSVSIISANLHWLFFDQTCEAAETAAVLIANR